jgi:hypothetical protein
VFEVRPHKERPHKECPQAWQKGGEMVYLRHAVQNLPDWVHPKQI